MYLCSSGGNRTTLKRFCRVPRMLAPDSHKAPSQHVPANKVGDNDFVYIQQC